MMDSLIDEILEKFPNEMLMKINFYATAHLMSRELEHVEENN